MQLAALIKFDRFQPVVVDHTPLNICILVSVHRPDQAIPLGRNERADPRVLAGLLQAALDEEAGVVDLGCRLPAEHDVIAGGCGGEADEGDGGVGNRERQLPKGEQKQQSLDQPGHATTCLPLAANRCFRYLTHHLNPANEA